MVAVSTLSGEAFVTSTASPKPENAKTGPIVCRLKFATSVYCPCCVLLLVAAALRLSVHSGEECLVVAVGVMPLMMESGVEMVLFLC